MFVTCGIKCLNPKTIIRKKSSNIYHSKTRQFLSTEEYYKIHVKLERKAIASLVEHVVIISMGNQCFMCDLKQLAVNGFKRNVSHWFYFLMMRYALHMKSFSISKILQFLQPSCIKILWKDWWKWWFQIFILDIWSSNLLGK